MGYEEGGLRNETLDHGGGRHVMKHRLDEAQSAQCQCRSIRQLIDRANIHRRGFLVCPGSDSRYLNGDMLGFANVLEHTGSTGRAKRRADVTVSGAIVAI
jgi:hypothetical protein